MRVLIALDHLAPGGIGMMLLRAIPHWKRMGIQVDFCLSGELSPLDEKAVELGSVLHRIQRRINPYKTAGEVAKIVRAGSYQVVDSYCGCASGGHSLGAKRGGARSVVSLHAAGPAALHCRHSTPVLKHLRGALLFLHRTLIRRNTDWIVGHSETALKGWNPDWKGYSQRCSLILNGIDWPEQMLTRVQARRALGLPLDPPILLCIGSLRLLKKHQFVLKLFHKWIRNHPNGRLLVLGDGEMHREMEQQATREGFGKLIRFEGCQSNPYLYYAAADLLLFPSEAEELASVLVEAQSAGLPVVALDIPAHRELVNRMFHPDLFELEHLEDALNSVERWLNISSIERQSLNVMAAETKRSFDIERFASARKDLYTRLTSN